MNYTLEAVNAMPVVQHDFRRYSETEAIVRNEDSVAIIFKDGTRSRWLSAYAAMSLPSRRPTPIEVTK